jgi:pantoate--beta-alanine ligase
VPCAIVREADGLAMSSRNRRLTNEQRKAAPFIYRTLKKAAEEAKSSTPEEVKALVASEINSRQEMKLEYFEIADADDLQPVTDFEKNKNIMGFIVVNLGAVRLIDNIKIF